MSAWNWVQLAGGVGLYLSVGLIVAMPFVRRIDDFDRPSPALAILAGCLVIVWPLVVLGLLALATAEMFTVRPPAEDEEAKPVTIPTRRRFKRSPH